jgi:hypothetical protein
VPSTEATLTLNERSHAGAVRYHKYMEDPGYRKKYSIRAGAETMVSEIVRGHGVIKSQHRNEVRTRLPFNICDKIKLLIIISWL